MRLQDTQGKFDMERAQQLGLRPGPEFARLKRGEAVEALRADGSRVLVRPEEIVAPPTPGPVFLVLHCPSLSFIGSLVRHPALQPFLSPVLAPRHAGGGAVEPGADDDEGASARPRLAAVFHLTPGNVLCHPAYRNFMCRCGVATTHVVANREASRCCVHYARRACTC
jgi:ribonuclease Z